MVHDFILPHKINTVLFIPNEPGSANVLNCVYVYL